MILMTEQEIMEASKHYVNLDINSPMFSMIQFICQHYFVEGAKWMAKQHNIPLNELTLEDMMKMLKIEDKSDNYKYLPK